MNNTIDYYNKHYNQFVSDTIDANMTFAYQQFLTKLHEGREAVANMDLHILDLGCGSGRDTKYFLSLCYEVDAIDGSSEMVRIATEYTGISVKCQTFQKMDMEDCYDGIWACASILHAPKQDLPAIMQNICTALKANGVSYVSVKYGSYEGYRNGRYYTDLNEAEFERLCSFAPNLNIEKMWISSDVRPGRSDEKWLNAILRKKI